jgi:hypothetical protein
MADRDGDRAAASLEGEGAAAGDLVSFGTECPAPEMKRAGSPLPSLAPEGPHWKTARFSSCRCWDGVFARGWGSRSGRRMRGNRSSPPQILPVWRPEIERQETCMDNCPGYRQPAEDLEGSRLTVGKAHVGGEEILAFVTWVAGSAAVQRLWRLAGAIGPSALSVLRG